ncbi:solute carrier organic anion transporter family member 1B2-like, partial [Saccoglossus kowalevskii]|uniref:Solute carrier organic anion transporter family member 1B2-like n=1 Tax=Saccoglossus kowalevskii TaxID=10224 RepID=A0ABM0M8A1_SACKO
MDNNGKKNNNHDVRTETEGSLLNHPTVNVTFKTSKTDENDYRCGISTWRPQCIQVFAKFHIALAGLVVATLCVTLNFASMTTSVSNWEKRYSLPSKVVGLAFTLTDVAQLVALLLVGYIGGRRNSHTPRWIGGGMVLAGIGLYIVSCLQFMSEPYQYGTIHSDNSTSILCSAGNDVEYSVNDTGDGCNEGAISGEQFKVLLLIFAGLTMFGIGISPIFILGVTYIDDNVVKNRAPFYLGMMFAMYAIGPLIGFPLSAAYSNLYVDFYRVDTSMVGITPYDPRWVGAWWLPFIINGTLCIMIGIPFMLLPKRFHAKIGGEDTYKQGVDESKNAAPVRKQKMKDLPQALKRLICNKTYLALMFVRTSDMALMAAFAPFCVKYISDQFRVTMSIAGIIVPFAFVIPSGLAIFVGGTLMRKYKPKLKTTARNIVIAAALTAPLSVMLIFIGCSNYRFTGINTEYAVG